MKISNETKIGFLAIIAVVLLIFGFNFLKGKNLFEKNDKIYAIFPRVTGLTNSNPVTMNGLQVGMVYRMDEKTRNINDGIVVTINLARDIDIPQNSSAYISSDLLGSGSVVIVPGDANSFMHSGDTLATHFKPGMLDKVTESLDPAIRSLDGALISIDSLVQVAGGYFDPATKNNFHKIIANLSNASAGLNNLIVQQNSALNRTLGNFDKLSGALAKNADNVDQTLVNLNTMSGNLAALKLQETLDDLNKTLSGLNTAMAKVNSRDGSLGLLLNDKKLYNNLENTSRSLNILLDDLRVHPKRYISISVFGKKDKNTPLQAPLADSTAASTN
ncbi:MAG: MlaD family protein [Flavihumibacter sp.]